MSAAAQAEEWRRCMRREEMFDWATGRDIEPKPEPTLSWEDAADERENERDKVIKMYREIQERADKRKVKQAELGSSPQAEKKSKGAVSTED